MGQDNKFFSVQSDDGIISHLIDETIEEGTNTQQQQDGSFNAV